MAIVTLPSYGADPQTINAANLNGKVDPLATDYNGNIDNTNIAAAAGIVDTKLATISTAGKVNFTALVVTSQAQGDVAYASSTTVWSRLGAGTSGQALTTGGASANPAWAGMTTRGDIEYMGASTRSRLAVGTSTQVLHGGTDPAWSAIATGDLPTIPETKGGTNQTTYTQGDIIYSSAANTLAKLAAGTATYILQTGGAAANPSWVAGSNATLTAQGDILYRGASALSRLAAGTSGQFLKTQGAAANPIWALAYSSVAIGSFTRDMTVATGTQNVGSVGVAPKLVLLFSGLTTANGTMSVGYMTATTAGCIYFNHLSTASTFIADTANCIFNQQGGGATYAGTFSALGTYDFTVSWTKAGAATGTLTISYLAIG